MKSWKSVLVTTSLIFTTLTAFAHEGHDHGLKPENPGVEKTITGQMIDMTCYFKHDGQGPTHKQCARECAEKGLPMAILSDDGKIYEILGAGHEDLKTVNASLLDFTEEKVTAVGLVYEKHGMTVIVVNKIKKAD